MDPHRLSEERSVAYHRAVAERLRREPAVLEAARCRVQQWASGAVVPRYACEWDRILAGDVDTIATFLVERSERADELRHSSPFAGVLPARQRWAIWRDTRDRVAGRS